MKIYKILFLLVFLATFSFAATNVSTCQVISSSGEYDLNESVSGAPYSITVFTGLACIRINASDVLFDCKGHNITNNGTGVGTTMTNGIIVDGEYVNVTIQNCPSVSKYTYGVGLGRANDSVIRNVVAHDNGHAGIWIANWGLSGGFNNLITDSTSYNHPNTSIYSPQYAEDGFYIHSDSNNTLTNNVAFNNTRGFDIRTGASSVTLTGNTAYENTYSFYIDDSENNRLEDNNISNSPNGIYITGSDSTGNVLVNNILENGGNGGIVLSYAPGNTLTGNTVFNYSDNGFYFEFSDNNTISGNTALNDSWAGFFLYQSENNVLSDNTAINNTYYGIRLYGSNNNNLSGNNAAMNGDCTPTTYHLSQLDSSGQWTEFYSVPFHTQYTTKDFLFSKTGDSIVLRIVQSGPAPYADVEAIQLTACGQEITPSYAMYVDTGEDVLEDILAIDNNVIVAHDREIEVSFVIPGSCDDPAILHLTANEYADGLPMFFPNAGHATVSQETAVPFIDGIIDETDGVQIPTYSIFWMPNSGHPAGYTYIYTSQDEENAYISLDITSDNTNEYGLDWAEVTFFTSSGNKEFRVDDYTNEYGKCGFGLTSKVAYKHQTCELRIPKSEIGDDNLNFKLRYYGTESSTPSAILLSDSNDNTLVGNSMSQTVCGHGGYFYYAHNNILTNNIINGNWKNGYRFETSNNSHVSGDHFFNNNNSDLYVYSGWTGTVLNLSQVIFDNPLGNLADYTTLSFYDEADTYNIFSINWSQVPPSPPYSSFSGKSVDIWAIFGSNLIESITWHWTGSESSGHSESLFQLWEYNSTNWTDMNAVLDTGANTLSLTNLDPSGTYAILYNDTQGPGITLNSPSNGFSTSTLNNATITFSFTVTDLLSSTMNCSLTLNGSALYSNSTVQNNTPTVFSTTLNPATYYWNVTCTDPADNANTSQTYSFTVYRAFIPSGGGDGGSKSMTISAGQVCPGNMIEVNATSGGSPLANAEVKLIYLQNVTVTEKLTDSNGFASFNAPWEGNYKIRVSKSNYIPQELPYTYTACPTEPEPEIPGPEPPPVEVPPPETGPANITRPPSVNASDQMLKDSRISVDSSYSDEPGCIIIHEKNPDGSAGAVLGMSTVFSGDKADILISLTKEATDVIAMLHYDDGDGICDPAKDAPATVNGKPVTASFKLTLPPAAPPEEPPKPPVTEEPPVQPPVEGEGLDLLGIILVIIILAVILVGGAAAWYYFSKKK